MQDNSSASDSKPKVSGTITIHLSMGELWTFVNLGVLNERVVPALLGTTYIDGFIKSIYPDGGKVVPHNSPTAPIFIVHEDRCKAKKNNTKDRKEV